MVLMYRMGFPYLAAVSVEVLAVIPAQIVPLLAVDQQVIHPRIFPYARPATSFVCQLVSRR